MYTQLHKSNHYVCYSRLACNTELYTISKKNQQYKYGKDSSRTEPNPREEGT